MSRARREVKWLWTYSVGQVLSTMGFSRQVLDWIVQLSSFLRTNTSNLARLEPENASKYLTLVSKRSRDRWLIHVSRPNVAVVWGSKGNSVTQFPLLASRPGLSLHLQCTRRQQLKILWALAMLYTLQPLVVSKQCHTHGKAGWCSGWRHDLVLVPVPRLTSPVTLGPSRSLCLFPRL